MQELETRRDKLHFGKVRISHRCHSITMSKAAKRPSTFVSARKKPWKRKSDNASKKAQATGQSRPADSDAEQSLIREEPAPENDELKFDQLSQERRHE